MHVTSITFEFQVGLKYNESVVIRVTGCPNGCARPYMAELGLVGDGPNSYQVFQLLVDVQFFSCSTADCRESNSYFIRFSACIKIDLAWRNTQSNLNSKKLHEQGQGSRPGKSFGTFVLLLET